MNIISMSWTVNQLNDDMKNKLNAALSEATKEGILMFCSSADDGQFSSEQIYPAAHGRDKLFRIGAAEPDGTPYSWVPLEAVDYIFPGVDVAQAKKRDIPLWKVEDVKVTGSSISTALAAGLAALVIWFIKAGVEYTSSNRGNEMHDGRSDGLDLRDMKMVQSFKGMQYAFKQLGADQSPSKKYVEIWSSLDERSRKLQGLRDSPEVALKEICHLARNLVTK